MGPAYSKVKCLCLPAQSGKTRKITDLIRDELSDGFTDSSNVINIIISSNNQLLVKQTESRMKKDLCDHDPVIVGDVFGWISNSAKKSNVSVEQLAWRIFNGKISMVVVCANRTRLDYLSELLNELSRLDSKQVNIWIDEADSTLNLWKGYAEIHANPIIQQITLISATWGSIFARYGTLCVMGFPTTCPECYRGLKDSIKHVELETEKASSFVRAIIQKYPHLTIPGMKAFIPGDRTIASHDVIADMLHLEYGFVVVVYNGSRKEVLVPGKPSLDLRSLLTVVDNAPQFSEELVKLYEKEGWNQYPFAITGLTCISRGVTMQTVPSDHGGFIFNYGIIPPIASKSEAYQAMGRLFGNIGDSPDYKPIAIYTTKTMFAKVEKQESIAMNLARMVHESGNEKVGEAELKAAQNAGQYSEWSVKMGEFSTEKEAYDFAKKCGCARVPHKEDKSEDGYVMCSVTSTKKVYSYDEIKQQIDGMSPLSNMCIPKSVPSGKSYCRRYIGYRDLLDKESIVFIMRVITKN